MSFCKLCHNDRILRDSHIVSEFLYKKLYNENHKFIGINGVGPMGKKTVQKGIREHLFCHDCEQLINDFYEKPFHKIWKTEDIFPESWPRYEYIQDLNLPYENFKLFHLSILYRASVSTLPTYKDVNLGPHQEKIRKMLLEKDAGEDYEYPISGLAVIGEDKREIINTVISQPSFYRNDGHIYYAMMYGGVYWHWCISSHRSKVFEEMALKNDGTMRIGEIHKGELGVLRSASRLLK